VTYRERLRVPAFWWLAGAGFVASIWLALAVALPPAIVWGGSALCAALTVAFLVGYGAALVEVDRDGFTAGRARLEWSACGGATALDAEATRRLGGVDADARAYLVTRPYLRRAVRVEVDDAADPTPYWMVSTRRPEALAAAIENSRASA
jgi:hypothetical protein